MTTAAEIRWKIESLKSLASPPGSVDRIFDLAADSESRIEDLTTAIESDPAVSARLLRLANSAYFGLPARVASIHKAIVVLGYRTVQNLAACIALAPAFHGGRGGVDRSRLWLHSCAVAEAARLAALETASEPAAAYLAGLLHDIGQVVLEEAIPDLYAPVLRRAAVKGSVLREIERDALGLDHAEAGGWLAAHWNLPRKLRESIQNHEAQSGAGLAGWVVPLAEHVALEEGFAGAPGDAPDASRILESANLGVADLESLRERFKQRRDAIALLYRESWKGG